MEEKRAAVGRVLQLGNRRAAILALAQRLGAAAARVHSTPPSKVEFKPDASPSDTLCFKHYNASEVVLGQTMEEWMRFSVVFWHTFRGTGGDPFGFPTLRRPWDDGSDSVDNAKRRLRVAFEFFRRLGNRFYTFHDRDMAPEGDNLAQTNANLDELTELAEQLQQESGVQLLWLTCNLFAHPRYANGAATNPDIHVLAQAAAQVKKGLEVAHKLGAQNFIFWGGREGFHSLLNTDMRQELDHLAQFFRMVVDYKRRIGFGGQFCIEPKPKEPTKHQYDYDAMTVIGFLKTYNLDERFKLNIEPNHTTLAGHDFMHDVQLASAYGMLGSIDANCGSADLGWDTDQFPMDLRNNTLLMKVIIEQGGLTPGGLNFDCKVRRESTDIKDLFIGHIGAMDALARGLKHAAKIISDGAMTRMLKERYLSFESEMGKKLQAQMLTLEECEAFIHQNGEPSQISGRQEHYEAVLNAYL